MPAVLCPSHKPLYCSLFPDWKGKQPLRFFLLEQLLEARRGSEFPTNGAGHDEDVNVFLAGLLTDFLQARVAPRVMTGAGSLLMPPEKALGRRGRAAHYLANAHHRLLHLGLMGRGDALSRRPVPFGFTRAEARARDFGIGRDCYLAAARLLRGRHIASTGLVDVLEKLGENFEEYVKVLAVMAARHLGLGARLSVGDLGFLLREDPPAGLKNCLWSAPGSPTVDDLLDLVLEYRNDPRPDLRDRIAQHARQAGVDPARLPLG